MRSRHYVTKSNNKVHVKAQYITCPKNNPTLTHNKLGANDMADEAGAIRAYPNTCLALLKTWHRIQLTHEFSICSSEKPILRAIQFYVPFSHLTVTISDYA